MPLIPCLRTHAFHGQGILLAPVVLRYLITRMTQSPRIDTLAAAHTPDEESEGLIGGAHVAIFESHVPREGDKGGVGRRRPVLGRLHIGKRMADWEGRAGKGHRRVYEARQLLNRRKPPP